MNRFFLALIAVIITLNNGQALSLPATQTFYSGRCISAIINCDYCTAFSIADSAMAADSSDPLAPLLRLTAIGIRNVDFDTMFDTADFFRTYRTAAERIVSCEKTGAPPSYAKTLSGFCEGIHAAFYIREKSYYTGLRRGLNALKILDDAYRLDTANVDPFFLLGLYEYAKGELKRRLHGILFWYPGSKKGGIVRLRTCAERGCLCRGAALMALVDIYTREKMPDSCAPVLERLERMFPASRFVLWEKAKYLELRQRYDEAAEVYASLSSSYAADQAGTFNAFQSRNLQAHMLFMALRKKEAIDCCEALLQKGINTRNNVIFKDTEKLLKRIKNDGH